MSFPIRGFAQITPDQIADDIEQSINISSILPNLQEGIIDMDEAVSELTSNSPLSSAQANELLNNLVNTPNIDLQSATEILQSVSDGTILTSALGDVNQIIDNIGDNLGDIDAISDIIGSFTNGNMPLDAIEAITNIPNVEDLISIDNFSDILQLPEVEDAIRGALENFELGEDPLEIISSLADGLLSPDDLAGLAIGEISERLLDELQQAFPDIIDTLLLDTTIDSLISSLSTDLISIFNLGLPFDIPAGAGGTYEIFPRDPKGSPVAKSCGAVCNCSCRRPIEQNHIDIRAHMTDEMIRHRTWFIDEFFTRHIRPAMILMTNQLSAVSMKHIFLVGKFLDASHQMETQRLLQLKMAETHSRMQLSEGFCEIASGVKGLHISEDKANIGQIAFVNRMMDRALKNNDSMSGGGENSDLLSRIDDYRNFYCNQYDNGGRLDRLCGGIGQPGVTKNKDINFFQTVLAEQTILGDIVTDVAGDVDGQGENLDAYDVFALTTNLFGHEQNPDMPRTDLATEEGMPLSKSIEYINLRSIAAKRNVAKNTFSAIVSERFQGAEAIDFSHLRRIVVDLGVPESEVYELMGAIPSYFAQRKVLTDYIYQNPVFYTELYESPENVLRKDTAIKALNLTIQDDFFDRQLESEATLAVILDVMLESERMKVRGEISN
ncbi:MAG: hypothetical protein AAF549_02750 [Pseudomonadota bacterium]